MKKHETSQDSKMKLSEPKRLIWDEIIAVGPYYKRIKGKKVVLTQRENEREKVLNISNWLNEWISVQNRVIHS